MKSIGSTKVGSHASRPGTSYPLVRLPQEYCDLVGKTAMLYEDTSDGKRFITLRFDMDVAQHVAQQNPKIDEKYTICELEKRIRSFEDSEIVNGRLNEGASLDAPLKGWARRDSNTRSSPCEGDVITS